MPNGASEYCGANHSCLELRGDGAVGDSADREALHPEFVSVLRYWPDESMFAAADAGSPAAGPAGERPPAPLPASLAVIGVLSVLRKPLALSLGDTAWVRHQLPMRNARCSSIGASSCSCPSPASSRAICHSACWFGPRRSEEPYNQEDLDLLVTIAHAVGLLLERSSGDRHTLAECDSCGRCYDSGAELCSYDHQPLTTARGSRLLNGRYRLERRLGRGGMGAVYAAVDDVLERPVAVKLIREDIVGPLDLGSRFRQEARAAAGFAHPHVVRVYDFGVDRYQRPFLVMELLEGDTLRQRLASGVPLSASETLHILRGVCSALSAAHGQGLVHRDLKPENIFLQRHASGVVPKVLDFGLAKAFDARLTVDKPTATASSAGLLVGTLEYMAPEQVAGDDVNPGWDVWAIGVIAYEMLTATHPFRRKVAFAADVTDATVAVRDLPESPQIRNPLPHSSGQRSRPTVPSAPAKRSRFSRRASRLWRDTRRQIRDHAVDDGQCCRASVRSAGRSSPWRALSDLLAAALQLPSRTRSRYRGGAGPDPGVLRASSRAPGYPGCRSVAGQVSRIPAHRPEALRHQRA